MNNDNLNMYDEIAIKVIVVYLESLEEGERRKALKNLDSEPGFFNTIVEKSIDRFRKDYEVESRMSQDYRLIGREYLDALKKVNTEAYLENVPDAVFKQIRGRFA